MLHLKQRNDALEAEGDTRRRKTEEAQRVLRLQLAEANQLARHRVELEQQKERLAEAVAMEYTREKSRAEVARQQAADAIRKERDRVHAEHMLSAQRAATGAVGSYFSAPTLTITTPANVYLLFLQADADERKAKLAREVAILKQRAKDRQAAEERTLFIRCVPG